MRLKKKQGRWNYQNGNLLRQEAYYQKSIDIFPKRKCKILDIGSGCAYGFEKMVNNSRGNFHDIIDCVDISPSESLPAFVRRYYQYNIEKEIKLEDQYDVVVCFEIMEHIDHTDILLDNCMDHLKKGGLFFLCVPNLSSIYGRIELLLGFQPHILEVSNAYANFGGGVFAKLNSPKGTPIHHIRGITYRACKEFLQYKGFKIIESKGFSHGRFEKCFYHFPQIAPEIWFVCKKVGR